LQLCGTFRNFGAAPFVFKLWIMKRVFGKPVLNPFGEFSGAEMTQFTLKYKPIVLNVTVLE